MASKVAVRTKVGGRISVKASGVGVEGQLAQRPAEGGAQTAQHGEHRAGELGRPFEVEDAQLGADLPMGHPLVFAVALGVEIDQASHRVVLFALPIGHIGVGQVGDPQQQLVQLLSSGVGLLGQGTLLGAKAATLRLDRLSLGVLAPAAELSDLLGQLLDLVAQVVALGRQDAPAGHRGRGRGPGRRSRRRGERRRP